ncbi:MAG: hypothetical protein KC713_10220, partial [Candidatus Omnitrophica bacterium]|nr:hypothetical protein [Candidatus Omnitrophota bacterium]
MPISPKIIWTTLVIFLLQSVGFNQNLLHASELPMMPAPGIMIPPSPGYHPALIRGITIKPDNALAMDFIVETGQSGLKDDALKEESQKMIKYFLASLTIPEKNLWVNLSPYEDNRVIAADFGQTEMGRDLLAQDYLLKQLASSLMYPEDELGSNFWERVYTKAYEQFGTTEIPLNTFNKVWVVPDSAMVYEHDLSAYVVESQLKVLMEDEYQNIMTSESREQKAEGYLSSVIRDPASNHQIIPQIMKSIIIPEITREVNEGKNFAPLRQVYHAMILSKWYKENLKDSLLGQVYVDRGKTKGIDHEDPDINQKIYEQYIEAFKKGAFNYIKEEYDPVAEEIIPRKYFSGGFFGDTLVVSSGKSAEYRNLANTVLGGTALRGGQVAEPFYFREGVEFTEYGDGMMLKTVISTMNAFDSELKRFIEGIQGWLSTARGSLGLYPHFETALSLLYENNNDAVHKAKTMVDKSYRGNTKLVLELAAGDTRLADRMFERFQDSDMSFLIMDGWNPGSETDYYAEFGQSFVDGNLAIQKRDDSNTTAKKVAVRSSTDTLVFMPNHSIDYLVITNPYRGLLLELAVLFQKNN